MSMLFLALVALLSIAFLVMLALSFKTWNIWHMIALFFVWAASLACLYYGAVSAKTQLEWKRHVTWLDRNLNGPVGPGKMTLKEENSFLQYGDIREVKHADPVFTPGGAEASEVEHSVLSAREKLQRVLLERGQVWRGSQPQPGSLAFRGTIHKIDSASPAVTGDFTNPGPGAGQVALAGAPPVPIGQILSLEIVPTITVRITDVNAARLERDKVVFAFTEKAAQIDNPTVSPDAPPKISVPVPAGYVGEFKVTQVNGDQVTLQRTAPLYLDVDLLEPSLRNSDSEQLEKTLIEGMANSSWTLYDTMPIDRHDVFAGPEMDDEQLKALLPSRDYLAAMLPKPLFPKMQDQEYNELIDKKLAGMQTAYLYDRQDIRSLPPQVEAEYPERVWVELTFEQDYEVAVDSDDTSVGDDKRLFDEEGKAIATVLRADVRLPLGRTGRYGEQDGRFTISDLGQKTVKIMANEKAYFDPESAAKLIRDGVAKKTDVARYFRPLSDYPRLFHGSELRRKLLSDETDQVQSDEATVLAALATLHDPATGPITVRTEEEKKLIQDRQSVQHERDTLLAYQERLERARARQVAGTEALQNEILQLHQELYEHQRRLIEDARSREAAPAAAE